MQTEENTDLLAFFEPDISSDVEAELYSQVHYYETEEDTCTRNKILNSGVGFIENARTDSSTRRRNQLTNCTVLDKDPCDIKCLNSSTCVVEDEWVVLGQKRSKHSSQNSSLKSPKVTSSTSIDNQFYSFTNILQNDSSECEIIMEDVPFKISKPVVSVINPESSSDDCQILEDSSEKASVNENFKINIVKSAFVEEANEPFGRSTNLSLKNLSTDVPSQMKVLKQAHRNSSVSTSQENSGDVMSKSLPSLTSNKSNTGETSNSWEKRKSANEPMGTLQSISKELWTLNSRDKFKTSFQQTQFYKEKARLNRIICHNCREVGHLSKLCKKPSRIVNCYLCGQEGHNGDLCPTPACSQCQSIGHSANHCLWGRDDLKYPCTICNTPGHLREECPDMWRRYCVTTEGKNPKPTDATFTTVNQYCCNCGKNGHFGYSCTRKTVDDVVFIPNLKVFSLSHPNSYRKYFDESKTTKQQVLKSLFPKKIQLTTLANDKFKKIISRERPSKRPRTKSDDPRKHYNAKNTSNQKLENKQLTKENSRRQRKKDLWHQRQKDAKIKRRAEKAKSQKPNSKKEKKSKRRKTE